MTLSKIPQEPARRKLHVSKECVEWVKNINACLEKCHTFEECDKKCNIYKICSNVKKGI